MAVEAILDSGEQLGKISPTILLEALGRIARTNAGYQRRSIEGFKIAYGEEENNGTETEYTFIVHGFDQPERRVHTYELKVETTTWIDELPLGFSEADEEDGDPEDSEWADSCEEEETDEDEEEADLRRVDCSHYTISTAYRQLDCCEKTTFYYGKEFIGERSTDESTAREPYVEVTEGEGSLMLLTKVKPADLNRPPEEHDVISFESPEEAVSQWRQFAGLTDTLRFDREDRQLQRAMAAALTLQRLMPEFKKVPLLSPNARPKSRR